MNRKLLVLGVVACAALSAGAQQLNGSDPYQGTSNPPPDDSITTTAPKAKPRAGKPLTQTQAAPGDTAVSAEPNGTSPDAVMQPAAEQAVSQPQDPDQDIVHPVPQSRPAAQPSLSVRNDGAVADPDGDIVHPRSLRATELAEGAEIRVRLIDRLSTASMEKGERFSARVASDVLREGQVMIPAGSQIDGQVVEVSSGKVGGRGSMRLRPEIVVLPDGRRYKLRAVVSSAPGSRTRVGSEGTIEAGSRLKRDGIEYGGAVGAGAATGAIVGGPVGALAGSMIGAGAVTAHLLIDHPQAILEPGTVLIFTLSERLDLAPETAGS